MGIENNTVSAQNQVRKSNYTEIFNNGGTQNVLFIGNSITRHEPNLDIGWENDWGMAATKREKDYVHVAVSLLEKKFGKINYCIANCGAWELQYYHDEILNEWDMAKKFNADIVVIRLGENIAQASAHFEREPIAPHYLKMVRFFADNPRAKVIVTGLFWKQEVIEAAIKQVAKEHNFVFVPLNDLGEHEENMAIGQFWHEGVAIHPNDEGMRKIAERLADVISLS